MADVTHPHCQCGTPPEEDTKLLAQAIMITVNANQPQLMMCSRQILVALALAAVSVAVQTELDASEIELALDKAMEHWDTIHNTSGDSSVHH